MLLNHLAAPETHQVILPALGSVFRVPLLLWRAHCRIHISRVSIAVVAWIISPVPPSPSHSGELKSKQQADLNWQSRDKHSFHNKMEEYFINLVQSSESKMDPGTMRTTEHTNKSHTDGNQAFV